MLPSHTATFSSLARACRVLLTAALLLGLALGGSASASAGAVSRAGGHGSGTVAEPAPLSHGAPDRSQLVASLPPGPAVAAEARPGGVPHPPARRVPGAVATGASASPSVASPRERPGDGIDVPPCRALQRWCLAHATATSPA